MAMSISQTSQMKWTAEHTTLHSFPCLKQRRNVRNDFLFSSQPEAYQDKIYCLTRRVMFHAKEQRPKGDRQLII
jgi:hypothetical protein